MIYTNKQNLPEALCNALKWDDYDPGHGDYSPSSLGPSRKNTWGCAYKGCLR